MNKTTIYPYYINWNYTYNCNFSCSHCYSRSPQYPNELSTEDYFNIAEQIIDTQVFAVGFGGGEPLLRQDCISILRELGTANIETHLTTNGWFLDEYMAEKLANVNLGMLAISLDSPYENKHDAFRCKPGSFKKVITAIRCSIKSGLNVYLSSVLNATNIQDIEDFVTLGNEENISGINFKIFRPAGQGLVNKDKYLLDDKSLKVATDLISQIARQTKLHLSLYQDGGEIGCACGITQITIRPNGDITVCPYSEKVIGNILQTPLKELWISSPELIARRSGSNCCIAKQDQVWPINPYLSVSNKTMSHT